MENNKPIKDWTLAECKEYCNENSATETCSDVFGDDVSYCLYENCPLVKVGVCNRGNMLHINLSKLTEAEKNIMRAVGAKYVTQSGNSGFCLLWGTKPEKSGNIFYGRDYIGSIGERLFPSVPDGDCIELED